MREKQAVTRQLAVEYKRATKKQKDKIIDTLAEPSGDNRCYAARVLRQRARYVVVGGGVAKGVKVTLVDDERTKRRKKKRKRTRTYDKDVLGARRTRLPSPAADRTARTTTVLSNRRTTRSSDVR